MPDTVPSYFVPFSPADTLYPGNAEFSILQITFKMVIFL